MLLCIKVHQGKTLGQSSILEALIPLYKLSSLPLTAFALPKSDLNRVLAVYLKLFNKFDSRLHFFLQTEKLYTARPRDCKKAFALTFIFSYRVLCSG